MISPKRYTEVYRTTTQEAADEFHGAILRKLAEVFPGGHYTVVGRCFGDDIVFAITGTKAQVNFAVGFGSQWGEIDGVSA